MDMELRIWSIERDRAIEADLIQRVAQARAALQSEGSPPTVARGRGWVARKIATQMGARRPIEQIADYRTPIKGLYHGSCATHGGGGVNGIPGWQAFNMAKKDKALGTKK